MGADVRKRTDQDVAAALTQKLASGRYDKDGLRLTREECYWLWEVLIGIRRLPRRRGPKPDLDLHLRSKAIATLFALYRAKGIKTKIALYEVCRCYRVSPSQVSAARGQHGMSAKVSDAYDPIWLERLIKMYERMWSE